METVSNSNEHFKDILEKYSIEKIFNQILEGEKSWEDVEGNIVYIDRASPEAVCAIIEQSFDQALYAHMEVESNDSDLSQVELENRQLRANFLSCIAANMAQQNEKVLNGLTYRANRSRRFMSGLDYHQHLMAVAKTGTTGFPPSAIEAHAQAAFTSEEIAEIDERSKGMGNVSRVVIGATVVGAFMTQTPAAAEAPSTAPEVTLSYVSRETPASPTDVLIPDDVPDFSANVVERPTISDSAATEELPQGVEAMESITQSNMHELDAVPDFSDKVVTEGREVESGSDLAADPQSDRVETEFGERVGVVGELPALPPEAQPPTPPSRSERPEVQPAPASEERISEARREALRAEIHDKVALGAYGKPIDGDRLYNNVLRCADHYKHPAITSGLLTALLYQESKFDLVVNSPGVGAQGIAQFMPDTAAEYGIDAYNPEQAIDAACKYLIKSYDQLQAGSPGATYDELIDWTLASYNAGMGNVLKYGGVPPFNETQGYVSSIRSHVGQIQNRMDRAVQQVSPQGASINEISVQQVSAVEEANGSNEKIRENVNPEILAAERMIEKGGQSEAIGLAMKTFLEKGGMSSVTASAYTGNLLKQTGMNAEYDNGGLGVASWSGPRREALIQFAQDQGRYVYDLQTQLDFVVYELATTEQYAAQMVNTAARKGIDAATVAVRKHYENPSVHHDAERKILASEVEQAYREELARIQAEN